MPSAGSRPTSTTDDRAHSTTRECSRHTPGSDLTVAKLNVDDHPDLAMRYNVMSIPTLLVFSGGEVSKRLVGAKSKGALLQELDEFLATTH